MIVDSRELPPDTELDADLCIVGGGAVGVSLARELIGTPIRVCLLESGGRTPESETQSLDAGENVGFPYYPLHTARSRSLGGSSTLWHVPMGGDRVGARMRPFDPIDFEEREWVPYSGWPLTKQQLDPYYARADALCRIGPPGYEAADWAGSAEQATLPLAGADVQTIIYKAASRELFAETYPREVASAANVTTCLHGSVLEIETTEDGGHVTRVRAATLRGNRFAVRARIFVVAAGGLETPRLLLLSTRTQPAGLGNQHDLVGRFFMEHLHFWSGVLVPSRPGIVERSVLYNDFHDVRGVSVVGKLALTEHVLRRERLLNQNIQLFPRVRLNPFKYRRIDARPFAALQALFSERSVASRAEHLRTVLEGWDEIARLGARRVRKALGALPETPVFIFANMTEQVPNPASRVQLGCERDAFGLRRIQLDWKITPQDIRSVVRTQEIVGAAFEGAGIGRLYRELLDDQPPPSTHGGYHHMGTTRMHPDPRQGVVDADSRVHGVGNLYIAGPSVFPTGGYANPTLTSLALTLRLADRVRELLCGNS